MSASEVLDRRRAGILLHPTSLPGSPGNGDFGHEAWRFIEFLHAAGMTLWQVLPLGPTHTDRSPYQCLSVHAGDPLLISLHWLRDRGLLEGFDEMPAGAGASDMRRAALRHAGDRFWALTAGPLRDGFDGFVARHGHWLDDYALYEALRHDHGEAPWWEWPSKVRDREPAAMARARRRLAGAVGQVRFEQYVFFTQWEELRQYAHRFDIRLFGDMPIFVAHDSAEVWASRRYFTVDAAGEAERVAGVPPDYFSESGQLWGNPLYRWDAMEADGFRWWIDRMRTQMELFDLVRIDHFRGLQACWEIPAGEKTAINGAWVEAPGEALLSALYETFGSMPVVAEDLGTITPAVDALRTRFRIPGMKVLQFGFDGDAANPYLPHNTDEDFVVYPGTHDNDTTLGWYASLDDAARWRVSEYLGYPGEPMPWPMIRAAMASRARFALIMAQDILGLGPAARMNMPGETSDNWRWRLPEGALDDALAARLQRLGRTYSRC